MTRSAFVRGRFHDRQPSARLRDLSPAYRVATDAFQIAVDLGCSGDIYEALWSIVEREAAAYEAAARSA